MSSVASSSQSHLIRQIPRSTSALTSRRNLTSSPRSQLEERYVNPWKHKSHLKPGPSIPAPLPSLHKQTVVLSDGSIIYTHTTAPTPQIVRLTRDVTNNPVWSPGIQGRGLDEDMEGAVGRFRRRFESMDISSGAQPSTAAKGGEGAGTVEGEKAESAAKGATGAVVDDLAWMTEGGKEEKAPKVQEKKVVPTKGRRK